MDEVVHRVTSYLLAAAAFLILYAVGFRMTEKFMEQLDSKSEKKFSSRVT